MHPIQNFAFNEHLVRVVDIEGEPWFAGKDVCAVLDIRDHKQALESLDSDERGGYTVPTPGGDQTMIVISEPGVYRLVFRSRKPEAEAFKRWLAHEVLPQLRRTGEYRLDPQPQGGHEETIRDAPLAAKVGMLHFVLRTRGKEAAVAYMAHLGLPPIPASIAGERQGAAETALATLLEHEIEGRSVRDLVVLAMDGEHIARQLLIGFGIKISEHPEGVWLGSGCAGVKALFAQHPNWLTLIRQLPGTAPGGRQQIAGVQTRTTWLPADLVN